MIRPRYRIKEITEVKADTSIDSKYYPQRLFMFLWLFPVYVGFTWGDDDEDLNFPNKEMTEKYIENLIALTEGDKVIKRVEINHEYPNPYR